ncbi:AMP-binding protein [Candidatus Desulfarcum epimagneticum]|uniref:AMP-binding protein n=1 Tax=uncultured Desulfobacteraceae bacterium TaxID=218296 RepID=A0A484HKN4_9BACT|nr:AMP-binding protein [uncultured Desulfobacteraceae bacterium]
MNVAFNLDHSARYFPDNRAIVEQNREIPFSVLNKDANRIASALSGFGITPGDHVALCAPNSYEWPAFYFGILKSGAVAVSFSHLLSKDELAEILSDCRPKLMLGTDERLDDLRKIYPKPIVSDHGDVSFKRLKEKGDPGFQTVDRDRHDTAAILYTGGTTGLPKGALLSHENLQTSIFNVARYERTTQNDLALCFLPLNHVFAQVHIMHSLIASGGGLIVQPGFDQERVLEAIERHGATKFYGTPTLYIRLLRLRGLREKIGSIRYCFSAAAAMAPGVARDWKKETGLDIYEAYGMTESASMVTYNHYHRHVTGSVGAPVNLVEVRIRDMEGTVLEQGRRGEICVRGPNIFRGYLNNPEPETPLFWGDWFRSGDMGFLDEDGCLYIVDRLKDMMITGGENVYPKEIEDILYARPEVSECAVVGLPDHEYGERVAAFIETKKDHRIDPASLKEYLKSRLAPFKVPKEYIEIDELPRNNAGKILKREIRKRYGSS